MESSQTIVTDRSGQKETLVIARTELDHVNRALKGLHLVHWMPRAHPEGDRASGMCAIDIQYPPHAEEARDATMRKVKLPRGFLCSRPVGDGSGVLWVWGVGAHGSPLGRPPKEVGS